MTHRDNTNWPIVSAKTYNKIVSDYNYLDTSYDALSALQQKLLETNKTLVRSNAEYAKTFAEQEELIAGLKKKVVELEKAPSFQEDYTNLLEKVKGANGKLYEATETLAELFRQWKWRLENGKAGPKALATNRDNIQKKLTILREQIPTSVI